MMKNLDTVTSVKLIDSICSGDGSSWFQAWPWSTQTTHRVASQSVSHFITYSILHRGQIGSTLGRCGPLWSGPLEDEPLAHQSCSHSDCLMSRRQRGLARWNIWFRVKLSGGWRPRWQPWWMWTMRALASRGSACSRQEVWLLLTPDPWGHACPPLLPLHIYHAVHDTYMCNLSYGDCLYSQHWEDVMKSQNHRETILNLADSVSQYSIIQYSTTKLSNQTTYTIVYII